MPKIRETYLVVFCLLDAKLLFFQSLLVDNLRSKSGPYVIVRKLNYCLLLCLPLHSPVLSVMFSPFRGSSAHFLVVFWDSAHNFGVNFGLPQQTFWK